MKIVVDLDHFSAIVIVMNSLTFSIKDESDLAAKLIAEFQYYGTKFSTHRDGDTICIIVKS